MRRVKGLSCGFTLIELMMTLVILAILTVIAVPSYQSYITKSRTRTAAADLMALATDLENTFARTLNYPNVTTTGTTTTRAQTIGWSPAEDDHFSYRMVSTNTSYTLNASGVGSMNGCTLTLDSANNRNLTGPDACGITSW